VLENQGNNFAGPFGGATPAAGEPGCPRFQHLGEPLDDLIQVGAIGLIKGIDKYDPQRGTKLAAFAVPAVAGEVKNYFPTWMSLRFRKEYPTP